MSLENCRCGMVGLGPQQGIIVITSRHGRITHARDRCWNQESDCEVLPPKPQKKITLKKFLTAASECIDAAFDGLMWATWVAICMVGVGIFWMMFCVGIWALWHTFAGR